MVEFASDTIYDILSRLPPKSLARFRCVSKPWCTYIDDDYLSILHGERAVEELTPIMFDPRLSCIIGFNIIKFKEGNTTLEAKMGMSFGSMSRYSTFYFGGSCNGLIYLSSEDMRYITSLTVIHPLREEFYRLPPIKQLFNKPYHQGAQSCGLGFDVSTNTFKMVCILLREHFSTKNSCTMVHVLGKDSSWREIPQVPPHPTSGDGIFTSGCLYWQSFCRENIICFDVSNEEFTLIYRPKRRYGYSVTNYQLVDLQGQVGYACFYSDGIIEVWVLKQNQWAKHCQFSIKPPLPPGHMKVLGRWNKYGDLLLNSYDVRRNDWFVYSLKSQVIDEVNILGQEHGPKAYMYMYPASSMFSIRGIKKTANSIKTDLSVRQLAFSNY